MKNADHVQAKDGNYNAADFSQPVTQVVQQSACKGGCHAKKHEDHAKPQNKGKPVAECHPAVGFARPLACRQPAEVAHISGNQ